MATYHKGGTTQAGSLFAKDLVGNKVWAIYPHWHGELDTQHGRRLAARAEVYELTSGGTALRAGSGLFFQNAFLGLPEGEWSVGVVDGPEEGRSYYTFDWPEGLDNTIERCMVGLPDRPALPEPETSDGTDTFPPKPEPSPTYYDEQPF